MPYSYAVYTGNGTNDQFTVSFPYIRKEHVFASVNYVNATFTWVNNSTIKLDSVPANATRVEVRRTTPVNVPLVDFTDGSTLVAADLDLNALQQTYINQEQDDQIQQGIYVDANGNLTAGNQQLNDLLDPTDPQDAATKNYVDTTTVASAGDTMTGNLAMGGNKVTGLGAPSAGGDAATKTYVDTNDALKVSKAGDSMTGALAMGTNKITGLGDPTNAQDAVTKSWVETAGASPLVQFRSIFYGAYATDPAVDPYGAARTEGDLYFNTTLDQMRVFNGTSWQEASADVTITRFLFTAAGGETSLSGNDDNAQSLTYNVGLEMVYLNGALLTRGVDYVATTGSSITGLVALAAADLVEVVAFSQIDAIGSIPSANSTFLQSGSGAVTRTVDSKLKDVVSVKDFGAVGDGVADDTAAFAAACSTVTATTNFVSHGISRASSGTVYVPGGEYNLGSLVDTAGKDILFELASGANIINPNNLNGRFIRNGRAYRAPSQTRFGSEDQATGFSVTVGKGGNEGAEVNGFTAHNQVATYADRDSTAFFAENASNAPLATLANATFTATTVVPSSPLTADQVKQLRVGMFVDTNHSPNKYTGWITGWASNGSSITVEGWYLVDGVAGSPATPSSPATAYVNLVTKIWAVNANATLTSYGYAEAMATAEFGVVDQKAASTAPRGGSHYSWGVDSVNLGTYKAQAMFVARGGAAGAFCGYRADVVDTALWTYNTDKTKNVVQGNSGSADNLTIKINGQYRINNDSGVQLFAIQPEGDLDIGAATIATTRFIDFYTSGVTNDYDVRIQATGGSSTTGAGTLQLLAGTTQVGGAGSGSAFVSTTSATIGTADFGTVIGRNGAGAQSTGQIRTARNVNGTTPVFEAYGNIGYFRTLGDGDAENTNNSYAGISDIRLKENVVHAGSQWNDIKALQVRKYNFKAETGFNTHTQIGLVAQEVELVSPGLVGESIEEETGESTKSVNYSVLYMKAIKALQESMERIEILEAKVAVLESA